MTPDSNSASHVPPDDDAPRPDVEPFGDDEAIDLGHLQPAEEESSALSFSGRSGSNSGGSSSGVRSWQDMVRESAPEADDEDFSFDASGSGDDIDPISDKDLLREVLADEPQPSSIILKDPSLGEAPALRVPADDPAATFALPPDLAATRDDSSILNLSSAGPDQSGHASDVFGSSSRVDLLRAGQPSDVSSGSLQRTDEMNDPPLVARPGGDSALTTLGAGPAGEAIGGSAVDLGSHAPIDLPFPLGLDSTVGSRVGSGRKPSHPASGEAPDSATVDLLASGVEFDLGLAEPAGSPSWAAAREDLPPTVPMVPAGKARLMALAGGGAGGLLAGVALCAGLWSAGLVPTRSAKPIAPPPASTPAPDGASLAALQEMTTKRDEEAKKSVAATADAQQARTKLEQITAELTQAKPAAAQAKQARDRADALAAQVKQAETAQAGLKDSIEQLTAGKATADAKLRDLDATLAELRNRLTSTSAEATAAKEKSDAAEAARKQWAAFAADVARRLPATSTTSPTQLLAALDQALARPVTESMTVSPTRPAASSLRTAEQLRQAVWTGVNSYRSGNFTAAETEFARLASGPDANAINCYYLGLAQWRQGRTADAEASFRRGWALERESRPPPAEVEAAFERLDRADREAVNHFRR